MSKGVRNNIIINDNDKAIDAGSSFFTLIIYL